MMLLLQRMLACWLSEMNFGALVGSMIPLRLIVSTKAFGAPMHMATDASTVALVWGATGYVN